jgi:hypothetical protein
MGPRLGWAEHKDYVKYGDKQNNAINNRRGWTNGGVEDRDHWWTGAQMGLV